MREMLRVGLAVFMLGGGTGVPAPAAAACDLHVVVVQPAGWRLPRLGRIAGSGPVKKDWAPEGVTYTAFEPVPEQTLELPRYCDRDGVLVLNTLRFSTDKITRYEFNGVPFAYSAFVRGVDVGLDSEVWWIDVQGKGVFSEFHWGGTTVSVPGWITGGARVESGGE